MIYTVTFKGSMPRMEKDSSLNKYFADIGYGYQKLEINCDSREELSTHIDTIMNGTDLKLIGVDWHGRT